MSLRIFLHHIVSIKLYPSSSPSFIYIKCSSYFLKNKATKYQISINPIFNPPFSSSFTLSNCHTIFSRISQIFITFPFISKAIGESVNKHNMDDFYSTSNNPRNELYKETERWQNVFINIFCKLVDVRRCE